MKTDNCRIVVINAKVYHRRWITRDIYRDQTGALFFLMGDCRNYVSELPDGCFRTRGQEVAPGYVNVFRCNEMKVA